MFEHLFRTTTIPLITTKVTSHAVNNQRPDQRQLGFTMALNTSEISQTEHLWQEVDNISGIKGSQFGFI